MRQEAITTNSIEHTREVGRVLGKSLKPGDIVALSGPLGAGKTLLTKGIADGLGVDPSRVTSPTFNLIHEYSGRLTLFHLDAYRLLGEHDLEVMGIDEIFFGDGVCVVEWADRVSGILPTDRLDVEIEIADASSRQMIFRPYGPRHTDLLQAVRAVML